MEWTYPVFKKWWLSSQSHFNSAFLLQPSQHHFPCTTQGCILWYWIYYIYMYLWNFYSFQSAIDTNDSTIFQEFSSRFLSNSRQMSFIHTPVPPRGSEQKLTSGKVNSKRCAGSFTIDVTVKRDWITKIGIKWFSRCMSLSRNCEQQIVVKNFQGRPTKIWTLN